MTIDYDTGELDDPVAQINVRRMHAAHVFHCMLEHLERHPGSIFSLTHASEGLIFSVCTPMRGLSPFARDLLGFRRTPWVEKPNWHPFAEKVLKYKKERAFADRIGAYLSFVGFDGIEVNNFEQWFHVELGGRIGQPSAWTFVDKSALLSAFARVCPVECSNTEKTLFLKRARFSITNLKHSNAL